MDLRTPSRRTMLRWFGAGVALPVLASCGTSAQAKAYPVQHSDAEWRRRLTAEQYYILRKQGTETPFTSPLNKEKRKGTFVCAADGLALFASATKYDSGTGWTSTDYEVGYPRTEVHCARCGGHLGHVFGDGPRPTGKRYCINGDAMLFRPG
jgi:peptide-methionine (R)-S-oxide reductase